MTAVPADVTALVRAGHLEEVEPVVCGRSRLPSRADVHGEQRTPDHRVRPMGVVNPDVAARNNEPIAGVTDVRLAQTALRHAGAGPRPGTLLPMSEDDDEGHRPAPLPRSW